MTFSGGHAKGVHAMQQCVNGKSDDLVKKETGENQKMPCSNNDVRNERDKIVAESVCKTQNSTTTTRAVFSVSI